MTGRAGAAGGDRQAIQASQALGRERERRRPLRSPARDGVPRRDMAARDQGRKGALRGEFAAAPRVRVADGPVAARAQHLPGAAAWLVCERRSGGERKYHLTNHPDDTPLWRSRPP